MILSDEEIIDKAANILPINSDYTMSIVRFARAIERAVLAKEMPAHNQEPVGWDAQCSCGHRWVMDLPTENCPKCNPPQSAAIPKYYQEEWRRNVMIMWSCVRKHDSSIPSDVLDFMREFLLSAAPKPEGK